MIAIDFQAAAEISAARVLNTVLEGLALAGVSWIVLRSFAKRNAVLRFVVWFGTLMAVVAMPLLARSGWSGGWRESGLQLSSSWATGLFVAWAVIAAVLLFRLMLSLNHVRRLRGSCSQVNRPDLISIIQQNAACRRVQLLVSDRVHVPTALGFLHPAIVLPGWALSELSTDELKGVLLHEIAHLRRWDDWTNLAQKFLKALFFFHPAVWWIDNRLALEREMACDDLVLAQTSSAKSYAASLVSVAEKALAEKTRLQRTLVLAQNALGRARQTSLRITEILNPVRRSNSGWKSALPIAAGLMLVAFAGTSYAPEIISFRAMQKPELSASANVSSIAASSVAASAIPASMKIAPARRKAMVIPAHVRVRTAIAPKPRLVKTRMSSQPCVRVMLVSMRIDDSGAAVWSVSVWRVPAGYSAARQLEEAFVMSSI